MTRMRVIHDCWVLCDGGLKRGGGHEGELVDRLQVRRQLSSMLDICNCRVFRDARDAMRPLARERQRTLHRVLSFQRVVDALSIAEALRPIRILRRVRR